MVHYNQATDEGTIYVLVVKQSFKQFRYFKQESTCRPYTVCKVNKDSIDKELQYVHLGNIPYLASWHADSLGPVLEQGDGRAPDDLLDGGERVLAP